MLFIASASMVSPVPDGAASHQSANVREALLSSLRLPVILPTFFIFADDGRAASALFRLEQLLQIAQILLHTVLHDFPGIVARLRLHLGEFANVCDHLLYAVLAGLRLF